MRAGSWADPFLAAVESRFPPDQKMEMHRKPVQGNTPLKSRLFRTFLKSWKFVGKAKAGDASVPGFFAFF